MGLGSAVLLMRLPLLLSCPPPTVVTYFVATEARFEAASPPMSPSMPPSR